MTDRGEREVRKWALKRNGDPISNTDITELVFAFADDQEEDHNETIALHQDLCARTVLLEEYAADSKASCKSRIEALIEAEHDARHSAHMNEHHADGDFKARLVWFTATTTGKLLLVVLGLAAGLILTNVWGAP